MLELAFVGQGTDYAGGYFKQRVIVADNFKVLRRHKPKLGQFKSVTPVKKTFTFGKSFDMTEIFGMLDKIEGKQQQSSITKTPSTPQPIQQSLPKINIYFEEYKKKKKINQDQVQVDSEWAGEKYEGYKSTLPGINGKFEKFVTQHPLCVVRYSHDGQGQLNYAKQFKVQKSKCSRCQADRVFELQLMPQLVSYLQPWKHLTSGTPTFTHQGMDWVTFHVYTCVNDCYTENFQEEELQIETEILSS